MRSLILSPQQRGALWMMGWTVSFSFAMVGNKWARNYVDVSMMLWMRCAFALLFIIPFVRAPLVTKQFFIQLGRGGLVSIAITCSYLAYRHLPTHVAAIMGTTSTLFVMIFSILFLKEHINWKRWALLAIGYVGVLIIIVQGEEIVTRWQSPHSLFYKILSLVANICGALAMLAGRFLALRHESKSVTLFYGTVTPLLVFTFFLPFVWKTPEPMGWVILIFIGACGSLSQFFMFSALQIAPASFLVPFEYVRLCIMTPLGWLLFHEPIHTSFYVGAAFIILSTAWLANLNRKVAFS